MLKVLSIVTYLFLTINFMSQNKVEYFGHRGCRGLYPENTIIGFKKAIDLGVDGIEWDVVVNKDNQLIISHEPYIDSSYCLKKDNSKINTKESNIYNMSLKDLEMFDCGIKGNKNFPLQKKVSAKKPSFKEAEKELLEFKGKILFEIKSKSSHYGSYQPYPKEYAKIIYNETKNSFLKNQLIFMSFDPKILNELEKLLPKSKYILLGYNPLISYSKLINTLNFKPFGIGLNYTIATSKTIESAHKSNIKVYAWTVNDKEKGQQLINKGIDGIITDYPNYFISNN
jgi:glycerophosphoryl diester phosphodiesterase